MLLRIFLKHQLNLVQLILFIILKITIYFPIKLYLYRNSLLRHFFLVPQQIQNFLIFRSLIYKIFFRITDYLLILCYFFINIRFQWSIFTLIQISFSQYFIIFQILWLFLFLIKIIICYRFLQFLLRFIQLFRIQFPYKSFLHQVFLIYQLILISVLISKYLIFLHIFAWCFLIVKSYRHFFCSKIHFSSCLERFLYCIQFYDLKIDLLILIIVF